MKMKLKVNERRSSGYKKVVCTVGILLLVLSGCSFRTTVINQGSQYLDPSGIVAGESTWGEVVTQLGLPPAYDPNELGTRVYTKDYLNYATLVTHCFTLGFENILIITPFRWCSSELTYELAVEFDKDQVVTGVYETRRDTIWPPFQSEEDRGPPVTQALSGSPL